MIYLEDDFEDDETLEPGEERVGRIGQERVILSAVTRRTPLAPRHLNPFVRVR